MQSWKLVFEVKYRVIRFTLISYFMLFFLPSLIVFIWPHWHSVSLNHWYFVCEWHFHNSINKTTFFQKTACQIFGEASWALKPFLFNDLLTVMPKLFIISKLEMFKIATMLAQESEIPTILLEVLAFFICKW